MESLWDAGPLPPFHILSIGNGRKRPPSGSTPPALRVEGRFAPFHRPGFCEAESSPGQVPNNHRDFNARLDRRPHRSLFWFELPVQEVRGPLTTHGIPYVVTQLFSR